MAQNTAISVIGEKLAKRMPKSLKAYNKCKLVIPGGLMSRARLVYPFPFYVQMAKGSKIIDLDGNEIIDCAMGYGPLLLGHGHPVVLKAIKENVDRATQLGISHEGEYRHVKLLVDTIPCADKASLCNSGTEAVYQAIRISRAFTGKTKIAKFEGGYHGGTNEVLANLKYNKEKGGPIENPSVVPNSIGIPPKHLEDLIVMPYNHNAAFDIIKKNKNDLAVVLVEVVQGVGGNIKAKPQFIKELRTLTKELGIVLLFDEVITGYRLGLGGGQEYYDVKPDIATYGKIIGGGMPVGAIAGANEIMDLVSYTGRPEIDFTQKVFYGGTFNGNLTTTAAGAAVLQHLIDHPEIYPQLDRLGRKLREGVNGFCRDKGLKVQMLGTGSMFCTHFTDKEINSVRDTADQNLEAAAAFYPHLLYEGVFIPNLHMGFISTAHTEEDVRKVITAHCNALTEVQKIGLL